MHYYQHNIADYRKDAAHLSLLEHGAYRQLLDWYYLDEQPIPKETKAVFRRLGAGSEIEQKAVIDVLNDFFLLTDSGYIQRRAEKEMAIYHQKADRARENGKSGGRPKGNGKQDVSKSKNPEETKPVISGNPDETQKKPDRKLTNKLINSLTNNTKPKGFVKPSLAELIHEFSDRVPDPEYESNKFLNYYESNGWMVGKNKMKSWQHTVTNWVTRRNDDAKPGRTARPAYPSKSERNEQEIAEYIASLSENSGDDVGSSIESQTGIRPDNQHGLPAIRG